MKRILILFVFLNVCVWSCKKGGDNGGGGNNNPPQPVFYAWTQFAMGADLSYVNEIQDFGGVYKDSGNTRDPFAVFKNHGGNVVRVRLWNNPTWVAANTSGKLYSDLKDVEKTIQRAKALGMAVSLDIHYSDEWADAGHQKIPAAWNTGLALAVLKDSVYNYTLAVLNDLKSKNLTPEMIQVGNETNGGMLYPTGQVVSNNWTGFGTLLKSGIKAVRDFSATSTIKPLIILHVAQFQNADWWINNIISNAGVTDFDILGVSHYFNYSSINDMGNLATTIGNLKRTYNKKIMIVETAYPWTSAAADSYNNIISGSTGIAGYDVSKDGQLKYMKDLTQAVINGGGSGVMYWEPMWITSSFKDQYGTGSAWENVAFFDFTGNALPVLDYMNYQYKF